MLKKLPVHIAIIMDGNGRWANKRNLPRFRGHLEGVKRVEEISKFANDIGIKVLTLFTFSTENWNRPANEVSMLMKTICSVMDTRVKSLLKMNMRINWIGNREGVPQDVLNSIDRAIELTKNNTGLILNMAFNYGSRAEIIDAVKKIAVDFKDDRIKYEDINEELMSQSLYTKILPDPDLLIRTSGEQRISNFLLWQLSYAEFYFSEKYWPDFDKKEFRKAISEFEKRERRFGKVLT